MPGAATLDRIAAVSWKRRLIYLGVGAYAAASLVATIRLPSNPVVGALFFASAAGMLAIAFPSPRLYGYTVLSIFVFLGFAIKLIGRQVLGIHLIEPTGQFDELPSQWNLALLAGTAACVGVGIARAFHLLFARRNPAAAERPVPPLYMRNRAAAWFLAGAAILGLAALNIWGGFYQIGLEPKVVLPFKLNVIIAWLVHTGAIAALSLLVRWELQQNGSKAALVAPAAEGFMVTVSAVSRGLFLLHVLPFVLWLFGHEDGRAKSGRWRWCALYFAGFVLSLAVVMTGRIFLYNQPEPPVPPAGGGESGPTEPVRQVPEAGDRWYALREVGTMVVGRWVGVEGLLAVASERELNTDRLMQVIRENPKKGEDTIFQKVAGARYESSDRTTFLTLPGFVGVLLFSGSLAVVLVGSFALVALLIGLEMLAQVTIRVPLAAGVMAVMLANLIAHMNFPYLVAVAFAEQIVAALAFGVMLSVLGKVPNAGNRAAAELAG